MKRTNENGARQESKATWSVVVVYEDDPARARAVGFCDQLVSRFWQRCEFDVSWWSFAQLEGAEATLAAAARAAHADLIAFASKPEGDFPQPIKTWIEKWLAQRGDREGLLVGLLGPDVDVADREGPKHHYLRNAAHQGALDYLTHVPQDISRSIPESLDSYTQRADEVTSLLDGILHQRVPPPHSVP
jgi:hypothetical protein